MATRDLSQAEQNFTCFAKACVDYIKLPLIDILNNNVKPFDLYMKLKCSTLTSGKSSLRPDQLKLCFFPLPLLPDYSKFDVTLLYTLIRNLCPSLRPTRGWGFEPNVRDTKIGDDIERIRLFRNNFYAHASSTAISNDEFKNLWTGLKFVIKRITIFTKTWNTANYEEELEKLENIRFGYSDRDRYKLFLEATLNVSKHSEERDEPKVWITGPYKVLCGNTAWYDAEVKQAKFSNWSLKWQKRMGDVTKDISSNDRKYKGSTNRQLVIRFLSKDDEGEYQAVLTNGKNVNVISNAIYLLPVGEYPVFNMWEIRTGPEYIIIHYGYIECAPQVFDIKWTKDGKTLVDKQYKGQGLNEYYLTITSPTIDDKGNYSCTLINAVGSVSKNVTLDVPDVTIPTDSGRFHSYRGSKTIIQPKIISCPPSHRVEWQSSSDGHIFRAIDISKPHYYGSSKNPGSPLLVIPKTTLDDMLHYRLLVWNNVGYQCSKAVYLSVTGSPPNIVTCYETLFEEHSIKLIGNVFLKDQIPAAQNVFWTKDGKKLNKSEKSNKYSDVTIIAPSLIIYHVNEHDAGSYQLTATNAVGSNESDIIVLDIPRIHIEREETPDGSHCFTAYIDSIPAAYQAEWKMRKNNEDSFKPVDVNADEFRGTLNTLPHPVLVIKQKKQLEIYTFNIEVDNFVGSCSKDIAGIINPESFETENKTSGVTKKENIPKSKRTPFSFNKRRKYGREDHSSPPEKQQAEHNEHNMGSLSRTFIRKKGVDLMKPMVHGGNSERELIYEGSVEFAQGSRTQDRFLILFNDILWVFKEKSTKTFTPKHRIRVCEIWVATCIYDVSSTMPPPDNSFVLGWPVTNVVATFRTAELKERWLNKLNKAIELERKKEVNRRVSVKVHYRDQTCIFLIDNNTTARDLLTLCIGKFHKTESEVNAYHLWVKTGNGKPYLLIGHEFPRSIKLSQLRNAAKTDDPRVDFDGKDHEYKRKSLKFILRKRVKESTKPSFNDDNKIKKAKKKNTFLNFLKNLIIDKKSNNAPTGKLFGNPLHDVMNDGQLSKIVMKLMTLVLSKGPYTKGVFRKSCNMKLANEIYKKLDNGEDCLDENTPILVVAHLFKEFLKSLPHCLLYEDFYEDWLSISKEENTLLKLEKVKGLLNNLPEEHRELLKHLLCVLYHIDINHEENTMTSYNLSLCIAPAILWAKKVDGSSLAIAVDWSAQQIVEYLIENSIELFGDEIVYLFEDLLEPLACYVRRSESVTNINDDTSLDTLSGIMYNSSGYPSVSSFNKSCNFFKSRSGDHLYFNKEHEPINQMHRFNPYFGGSTYKPPLRLKSCSFADSSSLDSQLNQYQSLNNSLTTDHSCFDQNYSDTKDYDDCRSTVATSFRKSFQSVREFKDDSSNNAAHLPSRNKSNFSGNGYHFYLSQTEINRKHHTPMSPFQTFLKPFGFEKSVSNSSSNSSENSPTSFPKYPFQQQGFVQTPVHNTHVNSTYRTGNDYGYDTIRKYASDGNFAPRPEIPPCYDEAVKRKTKFQTGN